MSESNQTALSKALELLSKRSYSKAILKEKLLLRDFEENETSQAIKKLESLGFIDDKKFAENLVREYSEFKRYGRQRIKLKLREKKIPEEIASEALENIELEIEENNLKELVKKNLNKNKNLSREKRYTRTLGFLLRRGFSYELSKKALQEGLSSLDLE